MPESERSGHARQLFSIWFAANIGVLGIVYGAIIVSFGMNAAQSLLAILVGSASFLLVGALSLAGRDGGAPMMTLSRKVFGIYGNLLPNVVGWLSLVGWETITVITGTLALQALFTLFWPGAPVTTMVVAMVLMMGCIIAASLLGQATLVVIQTGASFIFGFLTLVVAALLISHTHWRAEWVRPTGSWLRGFVPATSIVVAGTGLSWANAAADYSRYLRRDVSGWSIVAATTLGGAIPTIGLMVVGVLLASQVPSLASASNPIQVIRAVLPSWAAVPYLLTAAGGLVVEGDLSLYSSGLNLLTMFVPLARYKTVIIDAVIMAAGTVYIVLVRRAFLGPFESFIVLLGVGLASWAGVFGADQLAHRHDDPRYPTFMLVPSPSARTVYWPAVGCWILGTAVGLLFTASPWFTGPLARGIFAGSSLELLGAFGSAGIGYWLIERRHAAHAHGKMKGPMGVSGQ